MKRKKRKLEHTSKDEPPFKKQKVDPKSLLNELMCTSEINYEKDITFMILGHIETCFTTSYLIYNEYNFKTIDLIRKFNGSRADFECKIIETKCKLNKEQHNALRIVECTKNTPIAINYNDYTIIYEYFDKKYDLTQKELWKVFDDLDSVLLDETCYDIFNLVV